MAGNLFPKESVRKTVTGQGILRYINVKGLINTEGRSVWMTEEQAAKVWEIIGIADEGE